jgi:hypothetical protein
MSLISWNCRRLGNPRTVRDLDQMVKEKKPSFLFLMETINDKRLMERLRVKLGFAGLFAIDPVGRSGGLALLWREGKELEIQNYSRRHINAIVRRSDDGPRWKLTCFYGDPDSAKRKEAWALLKHLKTFSPDAWLCVGDFNEITHQGEKTGEARRREGLMTDFRSALEECNLGDLGFIGPRFTWTNKRTDGGLTLVCLDRAVANEGWCELHRRAEVVVLAARASDHNPLLVMFEKTEQWSRGGKRNFKFEDRWWLDPECDKIIKDAWEGTGVQEGPMLVVQRNLEQCQSWLQGWSRRKYGNLDELVKKKTKQLVKIQQRGETGDQEEIKKLQVEIEQLLEHDDIRWKQRAKQH